VFAAIGRRVADRSGPLGGVHGHCRAAEKSERAAGAQSLVRTLEHFFMTPTLSWGHVSHKAFAPPLSGTMRFEVKQNQQGRECSSISIRMSVKSEATGFV
jgi:hypothetical protein